MPLSKLGLVESRPRPLLPASILTAYCNQTEKGSNPDSIASPNSDFLKLVSLTSSSSALNRLSTLSSRCLDSRTTSSMTESKSVYLRKKVERRKLRNLHPKSPNPLSHSPWESTWQSESWRGLAHNPTSGPWRSASRCWDSRPDLRFWRKKLVKIQRSNTILGEKAKVPKNPHAKTGVTISDSV